MYDGTNIAWRATRYHDDVMNTDEKNSVARIGIVTVSDRASRGEYEDRGGPAILEYLHEVLSSPWEGISRIVQDDQTAIATEISDLIDHHRCGLVITTGGTGPAPRDVTPEATEQICDKIMPGFGELMRSVSLQ